MSYIFSKIRRICCATAAPWRGCGEGKSEYGEKTAISPNRHRVFNPGFYEQLTSEYLFTENLASAQRIETDGRFDGIHRKIRNCSTRIHSNKDSCPLKKLSIYIDFSYFH